MDKKARPQTILIVDDTPENIHILLETLRQGHKILAATTGEQALRTAKSDHPPDLIILDILMPGMDGYEVCKRLKEDGQTRDIPILFISALGETTDKVRAFRSGGVDYITKPFQTEEVLARVETHLALRRMQKELQEVNNELEKANFELERLANLDGLTQIPNRRHFDSVLGNEWKRMTREKDPVSLIMCDIDYFKRYNDTYGHIAGDECLKKVAQSVCCMLKRPADLVARYGGEEFAVLLPKTTPDGALAVANEILSGIRDLKIEHISSDISPFVTMSVGVGGMVPETDIRPEALVERTDKALYRAKANGRNRIEMDTIKAGGQT